MTDKPGGPTKGATPATRGAKSVTRAAKSATEAAKSATRAAKSATEAAKSERTGGAFAAGAARASGERQRRAGTPLISTTEPVEVSQARRALTRTEDASAPDPMHPSSADAAPSPARRPSRAAVTGRARRTPPPSVGSTSARTPANEPSSLGPQVGAATDDSTRRATRPAVRVTQPTGTAAASGSRPVRRLRQVQPDERVHDLRPITPVPTPPARAETSWTEAIPRPAKLVGAVLESAEFSSHIRTDPAEIVELAVNVLRTAATAAGLPTEEVERQVAQGLAYIRRRLSGSYTIDEFGFDKDFTTNVYLPLLRPLYQKWFRVEVRGIENIPATGGALIVANHSGTVALDSVMTQVAVHDEHPQQRHLRMLGADLVFKTPFVGTVARRSGSTLAANTDAERLLKSGELVGVWPEGFKGVGKPFSERYKLQRFGRGGFVSAALRTGVPIVPCSIVGAEEIYPIIGNLPLVARLLGMPYAPVTPTWPLLGPLGLIPLPSKWFIEFGPPIETARFGLDAADDPMLVFDLTDQVRETIQQTLYSLLMQRKSVFF